MNLVLRRLGQSLGVDFDPDVEARGVRADLVDELARHREVGASEKEATPASRNAWEISDGP